MFCGKTVAGKWKLIYTSFDPDPRSDGCKWPSPDRVEGRYIDRIVIDPVLTNANLYKQISLYLALINLSDTDRIENGPIGKAH